MLLTFLIFLLIFNSIFSYRSNVGTHPTTATQTRSTSRPHVIHQQSGHLGVGMGMGPGIDFDPFLPCNSHHVRRTPTTSSSTVTSTSQGTRPSHVLTTETQSQMQTGEFNEILIQCSLKAVSLFVLR